MYAKGALMLHTLRSWVNDDEKFFNMLRAIQRTFALQTVSTIHIENFISKELNMKLRPFFNQYLRTAALPVLDYYFEGSGKSQKFYYKWTAVQDFNMPVRVMLEKDKWTTIYPTIIWQSAPAPIKRRLFKFDHEHFYFDTSEK
jgi:aminopeptidase N